MSYPQTPQFWGSYPPTPQFWGALMNGRLGETQHRSVSSRLGETQHRSLSGLSSSLGLLN